MVYTCIQHRRKLSYTFSVAFKRRVVYCLRIFWTSATFYLVVVGVGRLSKTSISKRQTRSGTPK